MELKKTYMVILKPKTPLKDWVDNLILAGQLNMNKKLDLMEMQENSTVYLMPHITNSEEELSQALQKNANKIFDYELARFLENKEEWPENRSYSLLLQWFDIEFYSRLIQ